MARGCDAVCKDSQSLCFAQRLFAWSTPYGVAAFQPPAAVGFSFSKKVPFGFEVLTCQKDREVPDRILKLIVLSLGLIQIVNEAKNKFKKL